jgi:hypothetical protein
MEYSNFDLRKVKQKLGVNLIERKHLFFDIKSFEITAHLRETLAEIFLCAARLILKKPSRS